MIDWRAFSATRQVAILRPLLGATPEWDVLPVACRREGLAAVWLRRDSGAVQLLLSPWGSLSEWAYQGAREVAPVPALDREIERGRVGVWGRGELALAEALVVAWHLARPVQITYRKQAQLGSAGETRRITPTALCGASIRAFDHGRAGPRVFRFEGIDALEIVRDSVGVAWDGQGYALTGRAARSAGKFTTEPCGDSASVGSRAGAERAGKRPQVTTSGPIRAVRSGEER